MSRKTALVRVKIKRTGKIRRVERQEAANLVRAGLATVIESGGSDIETASALPPERALGPGHRPPLRKRLIGS